MGSPIRVDGTSLFADPDALRVRSRSHAQVSGACQIILFRIRTAPFRIKIILFRIRTLLFPVNGPLESSHLELFRSWWGNTLAIPVEIPTG